MNFLKDVSVLILGLGESGTACARFAHQCGAHVRVADTRENAPGIELMTTLAAQRDLLGSIELVIAPFSSALLSGVTQVVVSPGLSPYRHDVRAVLEAAGELGISVMSELDWFTQALAELSSTAAYAPAVLGITGTNGKTTVTELTTHLCKEAGLTAIACGNISPSALDALMSALASGELPQVWVVELSSFQLHYTQHFLCKAAAILNISQDHLDWHAGMDEYLADKAKLLAFAEHSILNRDDALLSSIKTKQVVFAFGLSTPTQIGDMGLMLDGGLTWLVEAVNAESGRKLKKNEQAEMLIKRLMPADALRLRGSHNHANAMAAVLLARAAGVNISHALHGLRSFEVAPNRCELLAIIHDVEYINDSKGTNVGATVAALNGLGEQRQRIVLLAGGAGKGQDFAPLAKAVQIQCKAVIVFGQDGPLIAQALSGAHVDVHTCEDLASATQLAATLATTGQAVLMSPACASFDQFKNYQHRADVFRAAVEALSIDAGNMP